MTTEKRSNEAACERSEARTPAFWRVVKYLNGERLYYCGDSKWTCQHGRAYGYESKPCSMDSFGDGSKLIPVYHRVVKKPKGHSAAWALRKLNAGFKVRDGAWDHGYYLHVKNGRVVNTYGVYATIPEQSLLSNNWELAE